MLNRNMIPKKWFQVPLLQRRISVYNKKPYLDTKEISDHLDGVAVEATTVSLLPPLSLPSDWLTRDSLIATTLIYLGMMYEPRLSYKQSTIPLMSRMSKSLK